MFLSGKVYTPRKTKIATQGGKVRQVNNSRHSLSQPPLQILWLITVTIYSWIVSSNSKHQPYRVIYTPQHPLASPKIRPGSLSTVSFGCKLPVVYFLLPWTWNTQGTNPILLPAHNVITCLSGPRAGILSTLLRFCLHQGLINCNSTNDTVDSLHSIDSNITVWRTSTRETELGVK